MTNSYSRQTGVSRAPARRLVKSKKRRTDEETKERQQKAVQLRQAGASYREIADALDYAGPSSAKKAVESEIRRFEFESTKEALYLDLARLDEWAKLCTHKLRTTGDMTQIDRLLRLMEKRHWLLGVSPTSLAETKENGTAQTRGGMNVVIAATERDFVRGMMIAVGMDPNSREAKEYLASRGVDTAKENNAGVIEGEVVRTPTAPRTRKELTSSEKEAQDRETAMRISVARTDDEDAVITNVTRITEQRI